MILEFSDSAVIAAVAIIRLDGVQVEDTLAGGIINKPALAIVLLTDGVCHAEFGNHRGEVKKSAFWHAARIADVVTSCGSHPLQDAANRAVRIIGQQLQKCRIWTETDFEDHLKVEVTKLNKTRRMYADK